MAHRCAILDDYQNVATSLADWSIPDVEIKVFNEPFANPKAAVAALKGFSMSGDFRRFVWANAAIEGNSVVVWSEDCPYPTAVRYGWSDNPECNLFNREGLPAPPFRTDRW